MNVMLELRNCCNKLLLTHGSEELILADAASSVQHKSEQDKSDIWSKVLFLMETPLLILTGIQSLQNNLLIPQERFFCQSFKKSCKAVGIRSSFSVRWFCVLDFLEDILRVKHSKYERIDGLNPASHQASAVDRFFHMSYQRFVTILWKIAGGLGLDLPPAETNVIYENDWNPPLRTTLCHLCAQRR